MRTKRGKKGGGTEVNDLQRREKEISIKTAHTFFTGGEGGKRKKLTKSLSGRNRKKKRKGKGILLKGEGYYLYPPQKGKKKKTKRKEVKEKYSRRVEEKKKKRSWAESMRYQEGGRKRTGIIQRQKERTTPCLRGAPWEKRKKRWNLGRRGRGGCKVPVAP